MSDEIEKAQASESFEEAGAIVQVHEFVYDSEALGDEYNYSAHLVIYGNDDEDYAYAMAKFAHAAMNGELDSVNLRFDKELGVFVTDITFRSKLDP